MKSRSSYIARLAATALLISCTTMPTTSQNHAALNPPVPLEQVPASSRATAEKQPSRQRSLPREPLIQSATATINSQGGQDRISLKVLINIPPTFGVQRLERERIQRLRAWVKGPGITNSNQNTIFNLNGYIETNPDSGQTTSLDIHEVPRGRFRVVTVQGYDQQQAEDYLEVPGATLKAVYDTPQYGPQVNTIRLSFTWRSTAEAEIIESLLEERLNNPGVTALLENLDREALNELLDDVIYGSGDPETAAYVNHPDRLNPDAIAEDIIEGNGQIPSYQPGDALPEDWLEPMADVDLVVRTPQGEPFTNGGINIQITDPASVPVTIEYGDTANLPDIVPGPWEAIVSLSGPLGSVSTRATVTVNENGEVELVTGTDQNPIILPPIITAISSNSAPSGTEITLTGDGFDDEDANNIVKFGDLTATVVSASATEIVVIVPGPLNGNVPITVTIKDDNQQEHTSNEAPFGIDRAITSLSVPGANPGEEVTLNISGYTPDSEKRDVVTFTGGIPAEVLDVTETSITVKVPEGASNGPITVMPHDGSTPLVSPNFLISPPPQITSFTPTSGLGDEVTISGAHLDDVQEVKIGDVVVPPENITQVDENTIKIIVPDNAVSGPITVKTENGQDTTETDLEIVLSVVSISSSAGSAGDLLKIVVDGFDPSELPTTVTFSGGATAEIIDTGPDFIIVKVPDAAQTGKITLVPQGHDPLQTPVYTIFTDEFKNLINFVGNKTAVPAAAQSRVVNNFTVTWQPHGINVDNNHKIYIADLRGRIFKFEQNGQLATDWPSGVIGSSNTELGSQTSCSGVSFADARFNNPEDVANDDLGNIYVTDTNNHAIRKIATDGKVYTLAKIPGPEGIEVYTKKDASGQVIARKLYVTSNDPPNPAAGANYSYAAEIDLLNGAACGELNFSQSMTANVRIIAGGASSSGAASSTVSPASSAQFQHVEGLGVDGKGRIYISDVGSNQIRRIDLENNEVTVYFNITNSALGVTGYYPGYGTRYPITLSLHEIRVDPYGNVFLPTYSLWYDTQNPLNIPTPQMLYYYEGGGTSLYKIVPGNNDGPATVERIVGNNTWGLSDGVPLTEAQFQSPRGVDFAPDGTLYVADTNWGVRKIERYYPIDYLNPILVDEP